METIFSDIINTRAHKIPIYSHEAHKLGKYIKLKLLWKIYYQHRKMGKLRTKKKTLGMIVKRIHKHACTHYKELFPKNMWCSVTPSNNSYALNNALRAYIVQYTMHYGCNVIDCVTRG